MASDRVHIIGGGVIGLCTAYYLHQTGREVTVIDKGNLSDGTSFGNAGMIVPSHFVPMPTPGVIKKGMKWLLDSRSPFYIKPRLSYDLLSWVIRFAGSATEKKLRQGASVLLEFNRWSKELYRDLHQELANGCDYEEKGLLMLFNSLKQEKEELELARLAAEMGVAASMLGRDELAKMEPEVEVKAAGGLFFPGDAHLHPNLLMRQMVDKLQANGVEFVLDAEVVGFSTSKNKVKAIQLKDRSIAVEKLVIASGVWSKKLARQLGARLYLQDGKGYSITQRNAAPRLRVPTILSEAKVAITPMGNDLRIGGTLEISGISRGINQKRVEGVLQSIPKYYGNLMADDQASNSVWKGYRPLSFDGIPYVGQAEKVDNLFVATGHGMMGLSLGAATGKLMSELVNNQNPTVDVFPFRLQR